jgi:hypothetical protein
VGGDSWKPEIKCQANGHEQHDKKCQDAVEKIEKYGKWLHYQANQDVHRPSPPTAGKLQTPPAAAILLEKRICASAILPIGGKFLAPRSIAASMPMKISATAAALGFGEILSKIILPLRFSIFSRRNYLDSATI